MFSLYCFIQLIACHPASSLAIKEKVKEIICKTVKSHCLLGGLTSGKCSEIFPKSKFSALFFACCGRFPFPEPLFELLPAAEEQAEESPPQQRVVDVPPAYVGIAIQYVQERDGRAAQPPQVDHAFVGAERPPEEFHAVYVDQLEIVASRRLVVPPEDVGLVEILVADPFFVEPDGETGEGEGKDLNPA